jgi:outer membrane protein OmpA-like peptidoglycan-associated protein
MPGGVNLGSEEEMKVTQDTLERLGTALHAGDRDSVMSCFAADSTVDLKVGDDRTTLTGSGIGDAVDALLTGFTALRLTTSSRLVSKEGVIEESVLSGDHTGIFAGAEPTGRRVCVNMQVSATWGPGSTVESLLVEADTRALFAQIAGTDDVIGVTGGLIAIVRERYDGAPHVTNQTHPPPVPGPSSGHKTRPSKSRRRWVVPIAIVVALLAATVTWRQVSANGSREAGHTATTAFTAPHATSSTKIAQPKPSKPVQPSATPRPVIATANPSAAPRVEAGQQVILKSDVMFAFDSATLTPAATTSMARLAHLVRQNKVTGTIQINGYTDNLGGSDYDSALSRSRALAVARVLQSALVGLHVTLVPQGFGQANPIAPNTSDAERARNRRVTVVLPNQG